MIDLFVDPSRPRQTSATLFTQIRDAIGAGRLRAGDRLPTSRDLAGELGVARSTVTAVYGRLCAEGLLEARTGDGTFVARLLVPAGRPRRTAPTALTARRPVEPTGRPPLTIDPLIDLRTGRPDPRLFPVQAWRRCVVDALQAPPPGYGDHAGLPALRQALAVWINRSRGVTATAEQIVVTAGAQQALDLIARTMLAPADTVAIEDPGYAMARRAFQHHGLDVAPVPVDADGIVVERIPRNARAVFVTPSHQSPTGVTMTASRRRALLEFAESRNAAIIEDDYDTELRHVDRPLEPIHRLDTSSRVLYLGTFSKTLSPSLRLGFMVVPEPLAEAFVVVRSLVDTQPPHVTQAALAAFIVNGGLDRHLRRARRVYGARHAAVAEHIDRLHHDGLITPPLRSNAGLHNTITLHAGRDAERIVARLAEQRIAIDSTADWWAGTPAAPGLVIGFGLTDLAQLDSAFDALRLQLERL